MGHCHPHKQCPILIIPPNPFILSQNCILFDALVYIFAFDFNFLDFLL